MKKSTIWINEKFYLDTCVLISAILERENSADNTKKKENIKFSKILWDNSGKFTFKISGYVLGEFIGIGRNGKFGKSLEEMMNIYRSEISKKCGLIHFKYDSKKDELFDPLTFDEWIFAEIYLGGDTKSQDGKELGKQSLRKIITLSGDECVSQFGGLPDLDLHPVFTKIDKIEYKAPFFEMFLFTQMASYSIRYNMSLKDAIHYCYAKWENVNRIITTDENFLKVQKNQDYLSLIHI